MTPSSTIVLQNNSQMIVNFDTSKTFIRNNEYKSFDYTNGGGAPIQLNGGALMGQISATQKVKPLVSTANDGSQIPIGILATDYIVAAGATVSVRVCVSGSVVKSKVLFDQTVPDTMATVVSGRTLEARIGADTVGVLLIESTENSDFDNQ